LFGGAATRPVFAQTPDIVSRPAATFDFGSFEPAGSIGLFTDGKSAEAPVILVRGFNVALQQFDALEAFQQVVAAATTGQIFSQIPDIFILQFNAASQQFEALGPAGSIFSTTPQGWVSRSPELFTRPFNTTEQQLQSFPSNAPPAVTSGPVFSQSPDILAKQYNAAQQLFCGTYEPSGNVPTAATPQGWMGQQPQYEVLIKAFNAAQQQFGAFEPLGVIVPPISTKKPSWLVIARRRGKR
jgi:hypothetical protein